MNPPIQELDSPNKRIADAICRVVNLEIAITKVLPLLSEGKAITAKRILEQALLEPKED